jgi:hypothetical protein
MLNVYTILIGKSNGKRTILKLTRRWQDNIQNDSEIIETRGCGLDSSDPGNGQLAGFCDDRNKLSILTIRCKDI